MSFYDFIEIGTSDFDTEIQLADENDVGLSIDPMQFYLDRLPDKPNCTKYNAAVSNKSGQTEVHYIPLDIIQKHKLNDCLRGCNYIGEKHIGMINEVKSSGYNPDDLIVSKTVPMVRFHQLIEKFKIGGIHYLKIDTEGHDPIILEDYCDLIESRPELKAHLIKFESNLLVSRVDLTKVLQRLFSFGYLLISSTGDTILQLPFNEMYQRTEAPFDHYYIMGYPKGYDPDNMPHQQTLYSAMNYARKIGAGGVTYENGIYSVRANTKLVHFRRPNLKSWVTCGSIRGEVLKSVLDKCPLPINYHQQDWVMVSCFYNLDGYQNLGKSETRPSSFYQDVTTVFDFDIPLIFFCDPSKYQDFYNICLELDRLEKTVIVPLSLEKFFLFKYLDTIRENRKGNPHYFNNRNTPAYACLVMSKIEMIYRASKLNPFKSKMIAWIDYAYNKRYGQFDQFNTQLKEITKLSPDIFSPDKYVLGMIDWVKDRRFYNRSNFYNHITTTFCGAFHFGPISVIETVYNLMKTETITTIQSGLGHAEEQIFFFTFLHNREKFDYFPTDYGIDIFNIIYPQRNLYVVYLFMLNKSLNCLEYQIANKIVQMLYKSRDAGKITIQPKYLILCQKVVNLYNKHINKEDGPRGPPSLIVGPVGPPDGQADV